MSKEIAQAISETLGTSQAYTDTITGAVFTGLHELAESNKEIAQALTAVANAITAQTAPAFTGTKTTITPEKIEAFLDHHGIAYGPCENNKWILIDGCPFNPDHISTGDKIAAVFLPEDGIVGFHCFHVSCAENGWKKFRAKVEATSGKEKVYFSPYQDGSEREWLVDKAKDKRLMLTALNLIKAHLTPGNVILASTLMEEARTQGISLGQLESARVKLGITKVKTGSGFSWVWPTEQEVLG